MNFNMRILPGTKLDQAIGEKTLPTVRVAYVCDVMARRLDDDMQCEAYVNLMAMRRELGVA